MLRKGTVVLSVFFLTLSAGVLLFAATGFTQSIEVKNYGGIPYMSGGIGLGERQEMESMAHNYNLKLLFAVQQGKYLSNVDVVITGSAGNIVLEAVSEGPWFYAQLPAGTYTVSATTLGKMIRKSVHVRGGTRAQLNFVWRE